MINSNFAFGIELQLDIGGCATRETRNEENVFGQTFDDDKREKIKLPKVWVRVVRLNEIFFLLKTQFVTGFLESRLVSGKSYYVKSKDVITASCDLRSRPKTGCH